MARRIAGSSIQWSSLAERVPPSQKNNFIAFKTRSDNYLRRVMSNPPEAPKIDWAFYKSRVPVAGMVDSFQKQYEALKIPYPADTQTSQVEAQGAQVKQAIAEFTKSSNERIAQLQKEIARIDALIPFDQMTMEDEWDNYPDQRLDPLNNPTYWPHNPEEQLGCEKRDPNAEH